jgi:hypothetical protein
MSQQARDEIDMLLSDAIKQCKICAKSGQEVCRAHEGNGYACTRPKGHEGDHVACGSLRHYPEPLARWITP